jgi:hypothetical protein
MRVRITKRMQGDVDGVPLDRLVPGRIYDVNASIGTFLIVSGWAAPVADTSPAELVPIRDETRMHPLPTLARRLGPRRLTGRVKKR